MKFSEEAKEFAKGIVDRDQLNEYIESFGYKPISESNYSLYKIDPFMPVMRDFEVLVTYGDFIAYSLLRTTRGDRIDEFTMSEARRLFKGTDTEFMVERLIQENKLVDLFVITVDKWEEENQ